MTIKRMLAGETRREFLTRVVAGGGLLASAVLAGRHALAFVFPRLERSAGRRLLVGRTGELALGEARPFEVGGQPLYLVNTAGGYRVFSGTCTHLGCQVKWEPYRGRFFCPCHQGVFGPDGRVLSGPPPRPLDQFRVEVEGSLVYMWANGTGGLT